MWYHAGSVLEPTHSGDVLKAWLLKSYPWSNESRCPIALSEDKLSKVPEVRRQAFEDYQAKALPHLNDSVSFYRNEVDRDGTDLKYADGRSGSKV